MKRATKRNLSGVTGYSERENPNSPPAAESGHNLYVAIRELTNVVKGIDERTKRLDDIDARIKRLEAAVVPPSTWERVKGSVGL